MSEIVAKVEPLDGSEVKNEDGTPTFLPTRYIHREAQALGLRITTEEEAAKWGGKVGEWRVTDDAGYVRILSDEEFARDYKEYDGASWPGKIALQLAGNLSAHGCKAMYLDGYAKYDPNSEPVENRPIADLLNEWAERKENFGKLITQIHYHDSFSATVFYTNTVSERERDEMAEVSVSVREEIDKRHRKALEDQEENLSEAMKGERAAKVKETERQKELHELAMDGLKHRENCSKKSKGKK